MHRCSRAEGPGRDPSQRPARADAGSLRPGCRRPHRNGRFGHRQRLHVRPEAWPAERGRPRRPRWCECPVQWEDTGRGPQRLPPTSRKPTPTRTGRMASWLASRSLLARSRLMLAPPTAMPSRVSSPANPRGRSRPPRPLSQGSPIRPLGLRRSSCPSRILTRSRRSRCLSTVRPTARGSMHTGLPAVSGATATAMSRTTPRTGLGRSTDRRSTPVRSSPISTGSDPVGARLRRASRSPTAPHPTGAKAIMACTTARSTRRIASWASMSAVPIVGPPNTPATTCTGSTQTDGCFKGWAMFHVTGWTKHGNQSHWMGWFLPSGVQYPSLTITGCSGISCPDLGTPQLKLVN